MELDKTEKFAVAGMTVCCATIFGLFAAIPTHAYLSKKTEIQNSNVNLKPDQSKANAIGAGIRLDCK